MRVPVIVEETAELARKKEPVAVGVPLAKGQVERCEQLRLVDEEGGERLAQLTPLSWWSDGSIKWLLVETLLSVLEGGRRELRLETIPADAASNASSPTTLEVTETHESVVVNTGVIEVSFDRFGTTIFEQLRAPKGESLLSPRGLGLVTTTDDLRRCPLSVTATSVTASGPVRATISLRGTLGSVLEIRAEVSLWSGRGLIRVDLSVRNPQAATHPGGLWDLGDPGSVLLREISLEADVAKGEGKPEIRWADRSSGPLQTSSETPFEIYQDSSGGERWDSSNHINREGQPVCSFRGYRVTGQAPDENGHRAEPTLWLSTTEASLGATICEFWQGFPKSLVARGGGLSLGLWPDRFKDLHELQGGEQKTHRAWLSAEAPQNLGWVQHPLVLRSTPEHYVSSRAIPHLIEWKRDAAAPLLELTAVAIDDERGFAARREVIDEYGWRNFGDVWADHENVGNEGPEPRISHYNNQYDGCYGALVQYLRSGDARWFRLGDEMARHLADIDVYHTQQDRPAFNGGFFWHTDHYTDAGTCTHRCYTGTAPQAASGGYGGGQSNEHLYASGMALHYLMTGWRPTREGALSLAEWAIDADDGGLTRLGKLIPGPTGLASRTIDDGYHGPGRGAGNVIYTLLDALDLTRDERYLVKAEELIRRCVHPDDDRDAFGLASDPEYRWSYTAFLMSLIRYLETKVERDELDQAYAYGQATLVAYARWMREHELLSSAKKDQLDIWSETWPAQDLRKGLILMSASRHLEDREERAAFFERGREMYEGAVGDVLDWDEERRTLARPLFLVMRYGYPGSEALLHPEAPSFPVVALHNPGRPSGFASPKGRIKLVLSKIKSLVGR